jgi:hypothetical protein
VALDVRRVSPETLAAVIGGVAGGVVGGVFGIVGALLGLFAERRMRRRGEVGCQLIHRSDTWRVSPDGSEITPEEVDRLADFDQVTAEVECELEFFNEKEVDVGLSRLAVVFIAEDGEEARLEPTATQQSRVQTVNVVSRRWSGAKVAGVISGGTSRLVRDWHTVEVRAAFPDHSLYRDTVMRKATLSIRLGA